MKLVVRYFAAAREAAGRETEEIDVAEGTTVDELRVELERRHERLAGLPLRFAVDQAFADDATPLADGAEVALIPPVSGG